MKLRVFSSPGLVGLDVQPWGIRLAQLRKIRHGFQVERLAMRDLPKDIFVDGKIRNWDGLGAMLSDLVLSLGVSGAVTAIVLPAHLVRMQKMQLSSGLTHAAIEAEIYAQVQHDLPGMTEALNIDYHVIQQKNASYSDVFFAVARQEYLAQFVNCVNAAGLKVKIADVDVCALIRMVHFTQTPEIPGEIPPHPTGVIYAGRAATSLVIFNKREIIFQQHWDALEGDRIGEQLNHQLQVYAALFKQLQLQKLAVYGATLHLDKLVSEWQQTWPIQLYRHSPLAALHVSPGVDMNALQNKAAEFIFACGSAMREVPRW